MIHKMIELLRYCPSGGNQQPCMIALEESEINYILTLRIEKNENAHNYTDPFCFGSLMGLGIMVYSVNYLAPSFGIKVLSITENLDHNPFDSKIIFKLQKDLGLLNDLTQKKREYFRKRFTDRNLFLSKKIPTEIKSDLFNRVSGIVSFETSKDRHRVINVLKKLSLIRFQNDKLFKELLQELTVNSENRGIPIKNLGLSFILEKLMVMVKSFPLTVPYDLFHLWPNYESVTRPLKSSPEIWHLSEVGVEQIHWMALGKKMMDIWMTLTENGIHLQPYGGPLILANYFYQKKHFSFSFKHQSILNELERIITDKTPLDLKKASIFLRVGYSNVPYINTPREYVDDEDLSVDKGPVSSSKCS